MSIGGIGSSTSFWQQDQNYWSQQQSEAQSTAAENDLVSVMSSAQTTKETGLSKIANQEALSRVNNEIAADEKLLSSSSGSTSSGSSGSSTSSSPYATGTGTVPLSMSTPLSTLGIPPNGTVAVSDGTNTTTYTSTGTDTIADLIGAINANAPGNAYVSASLNGSGKLVITAKNTTETITVSGTFASDVGFGNGNTTFKPAPKSSTTSSSSTNSSASSTSNSGSTAKSTAGVVSAASLNTISAESVLSQSGVTGSLVDMLA